MRSSPHPLRSPRMLLVATTLLLLGTSSYGQGSGARNSQQDIQNRAWALTHISDEVKKHFGTQDRPSLPQMREDFRQLQVVNNELMRSVFVKKSIEPKRILASITEIKKRATRLRAGLAFGESQGEIEKTNPVNDAPPEKLDLSPTLLLLDRAVMNFVNNPLFQQPKVLNAKLAIQAQNDLGEVLRLSEVINRQTLKR